MIDIRREKMFPDDVFVMDHLVPNTNYEHDTKKIKKVYEKKLLRARKSGLYKNYVFYSAFGGKAGSSDADGGNKLPSSDFGNSKVSDSGAVNPSVTELPTEFWAAIIVKVIEVIKKATATIHVTFASGAALGRPPPLLFPPPPMPSPPPSER